MCFAKSAEMTKKTTTILVLLILSRSYAQDKRPELLQQYIKSKSDTVRVNLLLRLSAHFLLAPLQLRADLDTEFQIPQ